MFDKIKTLHLGETLLSWEEVSAHHSFYDFSNTDLLGCWDNIPIPGTHITHGICQSIHEHPMLALESHYFSHPRIQ